MKKRLSIKLPVILMISIMILGLMSLIPGLSQNEAQAAGTQVTALVYRGPVVGCDGCSEAVGALLESDTTWDFNVVYVGPDEDVSVLEGLALPNAVLYAQPGGDGDLDSAYSRVSGNASAIRNFVSNGGRYLGFCMGGYLVDDDPGYALGINTDQYISSSGAQTTSEDDTLVKINWRGTNRWMYFQDGSYFLPESGVAGQIILARFTNNLVAAMVQPFGNGKVGVSGPHPEADASWYSDSGLSDPDGIDADLGHDLIDTLMVGVSGSTTESSAKTITSFTLKGVTGVVNETNHTIAVTLPAGTSVTYTAPTIAVSAQATVSPTSGTAKNFTSPVTYTVTAEDGSTQTYVVTVTVAAVKSSAKAITSFTLKGVAGVINNTNHSIAVSLPAGTSVTSAAPTIAVSAKATVSPASGTAKNFTIPVTYTVTAEDGSIQTYLVTVTIAAAKSSAKAITSFVLKGATGVINETNHSITINLSAGTSITYAAPTISVSAKASVNPASGTYKNFTNPLIYTVTAEDSSTQAYVVTVIVGSSLNSEKAITGFTLGGQAGIINETNHTVTINLPAGTSVTSLAPSIAISKDASISPATGTYENFTNPLIYTVTAQNGSTQNYTVTAAVTSGNDNPSLSSAKAITNFILGGVTGVINEGTHTIAVNFASGTNVTALAPDIYLSVKASISPGSGTLKNFTNPVTYTVTAENGSTQTYVVTAIVAATDNGSPTATISYSRTSLTNNNVIATLIPSETVTITSAGGLTHTFTQNGSFTFQFVDADGNTGTAIATVANIDKNAPILTLNGSASSYLPLDTAYTESGATAADAVTGTLSVIITGSVDTTTNGTYVITYTATDAAGNIATATRNVIVNNSGAGDNENSKAITSFAFTALNPDVVGIIDETNHKIVLTVPYNVDITGLIPTITVSSGATVSPQSGVAQNFGIPRSYVVTSSNGETQVYAVTVKKTIFDLPVGIVDGDIIQCKTSTDPNAVYIVKIVGSKIFIRHIVSLQIFNYYKHLKWENLKQVNSLDSFSLSGWVRANSGLNGTAGPKDKVYEVNGDQTKHWINMTAQQFLTHGGSDEAIYTVNQGELDLYKTGVDVMSL